MNNMWTFNIVKKTKTDENTFEIVIEFLLDGNKKFTRNFYASKGQATRVWLEGEIRREVAEFENKKNFNNVIVEGAFTLTAPTQLTPEQQARFDYQKDLNKFKRLTQAVELGIIDTDNQEYIDLKDSLQTNFQKDYIDLF